MHDSWQLLRHKNTNNSASQLGVTSGKAKSIRTKILLSILTTHPTLDRSCCLLAVMAEEPHLKILYPWVLAGSDWYCDNNENVCSAAARSNEKDRVSPDCCLNSLSSSFIIIIIKNPSVFSHFTSFGHLDGRDFDFECQNLEIDELWKKGEKVGRHVDRRRRISRKKASSSWMVSFYGPWVVARKTWPLVIHSCVK